MTRKLEDWVDGFMQYTDGLPSPELFRRWCAISAIAGALERRVWMTSVYGKTFAGTYTILVGPPGVGKTVVTSIVQKFWKELPGQHVSSSNITKAAMIDELHNAAREFTPAGKNQETIKYHSLKIASNELGVLLPAYENEFMSTLTDIYDGHGYSERKRTKELHLEIPNAQLHILAATTPSYLNNVLPEGAWDQGFLSRTMLVYSGHQIIINPFLEGARPKPLEKNLIADLTKIGNLYGEIAFTEEARDAIVNWIMAGGPPIPEHPKLRHYLTRRTVHLFKLCMVASVSEGDTLIVTLDHFARALEWLIEVEHYIPDIFKAMATGGDMKAIEDTWYFAYKMYATKKEPIPEGKIYAYLQARVPAHSVDNIVTLMLRSQLLRETNVNKIGRCFIPLEKGD